MPAPLPKKGSKTLATSLEKRLRSLLELEASAEIANGQIDQASAPPEDPNSQGFDVMSGLGTQKSLKENGLSTRIVSSNASNQVDETKPGGHDGVPAIPRTPKRAPMTLDHGSTTTPLTPRVLEDVTNGAILRESLDDSIVLDSCPPEHPHSR